MSVLDGEAEAAGDRGVIPSLAGSQVAPRTVVVILLTLVCFAAALYLLYLLQGIVTWIVVGLFLAAALTPPVNRLSQRLPRGLAILLVYLALVLVVVLLGVLVVPPLVEQVQALVAFTTELFRRPGGPDQAIEDLAARYRLSGYLDTLREQASGLPSRLGVVVAPLLNVTRSVIGSVTAVLSIFLISFYLLLDGARFAEAGINLFAPSQRPRLRRVLDQSGQAVQGYLTGNLTISAINGAASFIVMTIVGMPYAVALALVGALLGLIPLVGATLGAIIITVVAFFVDPIKALILLVYYLVYQQVENNILQPFVYGRSVHLHPLVIFIAILVGGELLGILGALLAIPVAEIIRIVAGEWLADRVRVTQGAPPGPVEGVPAEQVTADTGTTAPRH
ncbi:MAG TPA: AI-2E family transporter [Dehalococcoidia bacterium]|nr:AI-2E family transporter [Dehalococcoidia bacterium]